jgi:hypothetical protein
MVGCFSNFLIGMSMAGHRDYYDPRICILSLPIKIKTKKELRDNISMLPV